MSRGLGATQRAVLRLVRDTCAEPPGAGLLMSELASHLYGPEATDSERRSLRRAVAGLRERGLITTRRIVVSDFEPGGWKFTRNPPLTDYELTRVLSWFERHWYVDHLPAGAEVDPLWRTPPQSMDPHGRVTWFRMPKRFPRWETVLWLADGSVRPDFKAMEAAVRAGASVTAD